MGVAASDPNGVVSAEELAAGTIMKMLHRYHTRYTTSGPTETDIATQRMVRLGQPGNFWWWLLEV